MKVNNNCIEKECQNVGRMLQKVASCYITITRISHCFARAPKAFTKTLQNRLKPYVELPSEYQSGWRWMDYNRLAVHCETGVGSSNSVSIKYSSFFHDHTRVLNATYCIFNTERSQAWPQAGPSVLQLGSWVRNQKKSSWCQGKLSWNSAMNKYRNCGPKNKTDPSRTKYNNWRIPIEESWLFYVFDESAMEGQINYYHTLCYGCET